ncbi:hypothetical protein [Campylobacter troglodytis]|uniref:hypothetical protein n=1 Tax=Campylobacter troglodytis TaxID=654363 RepID=UPI00115A53DD|nr:hypothetical protein [Campylobacter troglodytis]
MPHSELYTDCKLICEENGKVFCLNTMGASFVKIKIDGGVEPNGIAPEKCDYMVIKNEVEDIEIFIELKGSDIKKAMNQLITTYDKYAMKNPSIKHYPVIVFSHYPSENTSIQVAKKELKEKFKNNLLKHKDIFKTRYDSNTNEIVKNKAQDNLSSNKKASSYDLQGEKQVYQSFQNFRG